jgi:uncharacterized protein (DUF2236 family)
MESAQRPGLLRRVLEGPLSKVLANADISLPDLARPAGESGLAGPDSVSWRVFKNPVALFIGGISAVLLEFAEPRIRSGVWDFTTFRTDPLARMQRTGVAAMITVYGARSMAEKRIAAVYRMHESVSGETPEGVAYRANDPHLLTWVHATAAFGFSEAYSQFVEELSRDERDRFFAEGDTAARLYGADHPPADLAGWEQRLELMLPEFEPSPIVFEFLEILQRTPIFPGALRGLQNDMIRAAVEITPCPVREILGLGAQWNLRPWQRGRIRVLGRLSERFYLESSAPVQACRRLGLPPGYLY